MRNTSAGGWALAQRLGRERRTSRELCVVGGDALPHRNYQTPLGKLARELILVVIDMLAEGRTPRDHERPASGRQR